MHCTTSHHCTIITLSYSSASPILPFEKNKRTLTVQQKIIPSFKSVGSVGLAVVLRAGGAGKRRICITKFLKIRRQSRNSHTERKCVQICKQEGGGDITQPNTIGILCFQAFCKRRKLTPQFFSSYPKLYQIKEITKKQIFWGFILFFTCTPYMSSIMHATSKKSSNCAHHVERKRQTDRH